MKEIVLIPAYCPDDCLCELVERLYAEGFGILVVDDGSGEAYRPIFERVKPYAHVLTAEKNGGKGSALKKGMAELTNFFPEMEFSSPLMPTGSTGWRISSGCAVSFGRGPALC